MDTSASSVLADVLVVAPTLHGAGPLSSTSLEALARHASAQSMHHTAETGSGASTLLLSHLSPDHLVFAVDSNVGSIRNVEASPLLRRETVRFIEGVTQLTLPHFEFPDHQFELVMLDGPHGWPFPILEYYYFYPHIARGGLLVIDDIEIPTIHQMFEVLRDDDMWRLEEVVTNTAFFRRTEAPTFPPLWDCWNQQGYNRRRYPAK